jgi:hypothetical protein
LFVTQSIAHPTLAHPALLDIEDQLDSVGQKYRIVRTLQGLMQWTVWAVGSAVVAALGANFIGAGKCATALLVVLLLWLTASAVWWIGRPLIRRPSLEAIARMIEKRVEGLHNGLTNGVLLSQASDLADSPWLAPIFDEIAGTCRQKPIDSAVRFSDLGRPALRLTGPLVVMAIVAAIFPGQIAHGWRQMLSPGSFVPTIGRTQILDVQPGDVSLVVGQPLEIDVIAKAENGAEAPKAKFVFDSKLTTAESNGTLDRQSGNLLYFYRIDHIDQSLKYRVEIGGTQSDWYSVQVVPKVTLTALDIKITPPPYTRQAQKTIHIMPDDVAHTSVAVPMGSEVEISATIDVPAQRAVLITGGANSDQPQDMAAAEEHHRFYRQTMIMADSTFFVGILGGQQIIAQLPETGLNIHCLPDAPPVVAMQSPERDVVLPPTQDLNISAQIRDDYGVSAARLFVGFGDGEPALLDGSEQKFGDSPPAQIVQFPLHLTAEQATHNSVVTVQVEATDNRDLTQLSSELGPQSARGPKITIRFQDPSQIARDELEQSDKLAARLEEMIRRQEKLHNQTVALLPETLPSSGIDKDAVAGIGSGQLDLRQLMRDTAQSFEFDDRTRVVQKTLLVLAVNSATDAAELPAQIVAEPLAAEQSRRAAVLKLKQESILETLQALLARLNSSGDPETQPSERAGASMPSRAEAFKKLDDALKQYEKEQQRILNQTAALAKKPVDDYDANDKKKLEDLKIAQDNLDKFMQESISDFSKNAEQDLSNPTLLKDLMDVYTEVTMAANALNNKPVQMAIPIEENGLEAAKELESNIEKWLPNTPDRTQWTQEDPLTANDPPMPELPKELEDMIGNLLEQQEDLDQQMEDMNANIQDSMDKGIGWDAVDGPIADMSAKGVTGNQLPNNNEMQGRSGDGRSGKADGEMVGDTHTDKGGRNTPTRLVPSPFQAGQVKSTSNDSPGGATGGGKVSGAGAAGLEGPAPKFQQDVGRLAHQQAQIRNAAERLNLQYKLGRYDNFKLLNAIVNMRQVESDLNANRYQNALRHADVLVDDLTTSSILLGGRINVQQDTTPTASRKTRKEIEDAAQGDLPPVWSESLKEYYRKLAEE